MPQSISCPTNTEIYSLQNLGQAMLPLFEDKALLIIDPKQKLHHNAYAIIEYNDILYFRKFEIVGDNKFLSPLNIAYPKIHIRGGFECRGVVIQKKTLGKKVVHYYSFDKDLKKLKFNPKGN